MTPYVIAGLSLLGGIIAAILAFAANVGTRQQALREVDLIKKLREIDLNEEAANVEAVLKRRVVRWSSRTSRTLNGISRFFSVSIVMAFIVVVGVGVAPVLRKGFPEGLREPLPVAPLWWTGASLLLYFLFGQAAVRHVRRDPWIEAQAPKVTDVEEHG